MWDSLATAFLQQQQHWLVLDNSITSNSTTPQLQPQPVHVNKHTYPLFSTFKGTLDT
jgi:hypothetical protein